MLKDARKQLKKNGILDPSGEVNEDEQDSEVLHRSLEKLTAEGSTVVVTEKPDVSCTVSEEAAVERVERVEMAGETLRLLKAAEKERAEREAAAAFGQAQAPDGPVQPDPSWIAGEAALNA